jgi:hypothetical protein
MIQDLTPHAFMTERNLGNLVKLFELSASNKPLKNVAKEARLSGAL